MIIKCIGIAILGICLSLTIKSIAPVFTPFIICSSSIVIIMLCLIESDAYIQYYYELCTQCGYSDYFKVMLKGLGVAFIANIGCELCRDSGEAQLASGIELAAKAEILAVAFPLIKKLIEMSKEIMM